MGIFQAALMATAVCVGIGQVTPRDRSAALRKDGRLLYDASADEFPSRKDGSA